MNLRSLLPRRPSSLRLCTTRSRNLATHAPSAWSSPLERTARIPYEKVSQNIKLVRSRLNRPLTYSEKILYGHLDDPEGQELVRGKSQLSLRPVRVALHDANAQMALLQFMSAGLPRVRTPSSVHVDHLITAKNGAALDLAAAIHTNKEVYDFLESACAKYGIAYWKAGAGILHQVIFEQYAYPGGFFTGSDSHTPNAAGLGMLGIGVGGMEAVDVMAGLPYEVTNPKVIGVKLTGQMSGWTSPKDIILKVASLLTVKGGTGHIIEYYGPGVETISCTGMATIGNMGAEVGATSTIFPYTDSMGNFLKATRRGETVQALQPYRQDLRADEDAEYDRLIEIDLNTLEPHVNGPFTPDLSHPISTFADRVRESTWPTTISAAHIGSCTNSSYEDLSRAASIAQQAENAGLKLKSNFFVAPGSEEIRATADRDNVFDVMVSAGGTMLANACGACVGQWERDDFKRGEKNSIISSFNRNFVARQDGNPATHSFVASPEIAVAMAYAGSLSFNPLTDSIPLPNGSSFRFSPPEGPQLPENGYVSTLEYYGAPPENGDDITLAVSPTSDRVQIIKPFDAWNGEDTMELRVLIKVKGKCTTDHISAAGPWYKYRGHLENISQNLLLGAVNSDNGKANLVRHLVTGRWGPVPGTASSYRDAGIQWAVVADSNYGEGSSREVAALSPRFMGGRAIIAKSFARIHEMNLKKQGLLPLTFTDPSDYDVVESSDTLSLKGLKSLAPGQRVSLLVIRPDGSSREILLNHTFTERQLNWFRAGSALNTLRQTAN
ncbi:putative aconitate hydratase [Meredithblackwellia eburnea MCA 4105]